MAYLLRHKPEHGNLTLDPEGWTPLEDVAVAVSKMLRYEVSTSRIHRLIDEDNIVRFDIENEKIRATRKPYRKPGFSYGSPRSSSLPPTPDILYHATSRERLADLIDGEWVHCGPRPFCLSETEAQAWRAAHRSGDAEPVVLYVDASRCRRKGIRFRRNKRTGLYMADRVPRRDVLNLQPRFAEQLSAGGLPLGRGPSGKLHIALIRVTRRSGVTWEVAKGKLEPGESPELTAVREVQEEMGVACTFEILRDVGIVRYGFVAPGGLPRLKTVYLYLMRPLGSMDEFNPSVREGIGAVRWFPLDEACKVVRHSSLQPLMRQVRSVLQSGGIDADMLPPVTAA